MGRNPRISFPGAIFHARARGNARQSIFLCEADWEFFLDLLEEQKAKTSFRLYAYCLMSNHLHLVIEPVVATISLIMKALLSRYAKYLNARLGRIGHVFQDRFQASLCQRGEYFQELARYIHLNPVRARMVGEPSAWPYSGHREYLGTGSRSIVDRDLLLSMFCEDPGAARQAYRRFVQEGISDESGGGRLGSAPLLGGAVSPSGWVASDRIGGPPLPREFEVIIAGCSSAAGIPVAMLRSPTKMRSVCQARREFMRAALGDGYSMTEIASYLRQSVSAVSKALALPRES
jgi:REP element-mobilizing transposase RayT